MRSKFFGLETLAKMLLVAGLLPFGCEATKPAPELHTSPEEGSETAGSQAQVVPISAESRRIVVEVRGFKTDEGQCRMAIYVGKKGFNQPDQAVDRLAVPIVVDADQTLRVQWSIDLDEILREADGRDSSPLDKSLLDTKSTGEQTSSMASELSFAIGAHHDRNANEKLDKNALGMPTEPYGFSNNPKRGFGPPSYEEAAVKVGGGIELGSEPIRVVIDVR